MLTVNYSSSLSSMTSHNSQPPRKLHVPVSLKEGKRKENRRGKEPKESHTYDAKPLETVHTFIRKSSAPNVVQ
jgi:hypothetical protein